MFLTRDWINESLSKSLFMKIKKEFLIFKNYFHKITIANPYVFNRNIFLALIVFLGSLAFIILSTISLVEWKDMLKENQILKARFFLFSKSEPTQIILISTLIILLITCIFFLLLTLIRSHKTTKAQAHMLYEAKKMAKVKLLESSRHLQELKFLKDLTQALQTCSSLKMDAIPIAKYCELLLPSTSGIVYLTNNKTGKLSPFFKWGLKSSKSLSFPISKCMAFLSRNPYYLSGKGYIDSCEHLKNFVSENPSSLNLCLPLTDQDGILGLLHIRDYSYSKTDKNPFLIPETLAIQLSLSISNIKKGDLLKDQAIRDPLTNLFNRRYLNETLPRELHYALRQSLPLAILMIDIDYFKKVNDTYGHETGDDVLKNIGLILQEYFRKSDIPCRFGGEEFILVLPGTSLNTAIQKAEQLRQAVTNLRLSFEDEIIKGLSISLGVASFPEHGHSTNGLIGAADQALYRAKELGRNRVEVATSDFMSLKKP